MNREPAEDERWMAAALNPVFDALCRTTVDAFVLRAQKIYGPAS